MATVDEQPAVAEVVRKDPREEVLEVLDFYKFALRKDATYNGTVVFDVKASDTNPAFVVSIRVDSGRGAVTSWDSLPPDGKYSAYTEISRDDFFYVYSGRASSAAVGAMCLSGRIKVRWFRFHDLKNFATSFDYSTPTWIAFYNGRGQAEKARELLVQQWRRAEKAPAASPMLVRADGVIVSRASLSDAEAAEVEAARRQLFAAEAGAPSTPAAAPTTSTDASGAATAAVAVASAGAALSEREESGDADAAGPSNGGAAWSELFASEEEADSLLLLRDLLSQPPPHPSQLPPAPLCMSAPAASVSDLTFVAAVPGLVTAPPSWLSSLAHATRGEPAADDTGSGVFDSFKSFFGFGSSSGKERSLQDSTRALVQRDDDGVVAPWTAAVGSALAWTVTVRRRLPLPLLMTRTDFACGRSSAADGGGPSLSPLMSLLAPQLRDFVLLRPVSDAAPSLRLRSAAATLQWLNSLRCWPTLRLGGAAAVDVRDFGLWPDLTSLRAQQASAVVGTDSASAPPAPPSSYFSWFGASDAHTEGVADDDPFHAPPPSARRGARGAVIATATPAPRRRSLQQWLVADEGHDRRSASRTDADTASASSASGDTAVDGAYLATLQAHTPLHSDVSPAHGSEQAEADDILSSVRQLRQRLRNEAARFELEAAQQSAAAPQGSPPPFLSFGPRHPLLAPPVVVPTTSADATTADAAGVPLLPSLFAPGLVLPAGMMPTAGVPTRIPVTTDTAAATYQRWAATAPSAPVLEPCQAETALWCMGSPVEWPRLTPALSLFETSPPTSPKPRPRPVVTLGTVQLPAASSTDATDGAAAPVVHFLPVWRPRRLTIPPTHAAPWQSHVHHNHSPQPGEVLLASATAHVAAAATPVSTAATGKADAAAAPPAVLPWVVSRSREPPLIYNGPGSGVWLQNALARKRIELEDAAFDVQSHDTPHEDPTGAAQQHHQPSSGGPPPLPPLFTPSDRHMVDYEDSETVPFAGRSVSMLLSALRPQNVRELARRIRERRMVKLYGQQQQQSQSQQPDGRRE